MSTLYKVRDRRNKGWFYLDNEYLNGLGKHLGLAAIGVYVSLCRHANSEQKCFPAQETIAEELGVSIATVKRYLRLLRKHNVIAVERVKKGRKWAHNMYHLLDKSEWIYPDNVQGSGVTRDVQGSERPLSGVTSDPYQGSQGATKNTNRSILIKNTNKDDIKDVIPDGNQMDPQVRLGKVRLGKVNTLAGVNPAGDQETIVQIIDEFVKFNPSCKKMYGNKTQRRAIQDLVAEHGVQNLTKVVQLLPQTNSKPYFPTITTPLQLENKWVQLKSAYERDRTIRNKNKIVW